MAEPSGATSSAEAWLAAIASVQASDHRIIHFCVIPHLKSGGLLLAGRVGFINHTALEGGRTIKVV
jgi:hypothetical protein